MRAILVACALAVLLPGRIAAAQSATAVDFSGRWVLADSAAARPLGPETLDITAPDELLVTQTPVAITIEHTARPGTHPAAGTFRFGSGGTVGGIPGATPGIPIRASESRSEVSFVGTQLIMSHSTTTWTANSAAITSATGAIWLLDHAGRLVIEFDERRTGENPKRATLLYVRSSR